MWESVYFRHSCFVIVWEYFYFTLFWGLQFHWHHFYQQCLSLKTFPFSLVLGSSPWSTLQVLSHPCSSFHSFWSSEEPHLGPSQSSVPTKFACYIWHFICDVCIHRRKQHRLKMFKQCLCRWDIHIHFLTQCSLITMWHLLHAEHCKQYRDDWQDAGECVGYMQVIHNHR